MDLLKEEISDERTRKMKHKKIIYLLLILLAVLIIYRLVAGTVFWQISLWHGDYPGPKQLSNMSSNHTPPDWLLIHGSDLDAREYKEVTSEYKRPTMVALSLTRHNEGLQFADPGKAAAIELVNYLKTHKPRKGIIGHSTAALWIADAYQRCPSCFNGLKIILLAPNSGSDIQSYYTFLSYFLPLFNIFVPNPYIPIAPLKSCEGVNNEYYYKCKQYYLAGRLLRLQSIPYFQKLFRYMAETNKEHVYQHFLKADHKNIIFYLDADDRILKKEDIINLAKEFSIPYTIIPQSTHFGIIMSNKVWVPKANPPRRSDQ